jgi:hypothetical protein
MDVLVFFLAPDEVQLALQYVDFGFKLVHAWLVVAHRRYVVEGIRSCHSKAVKFNLEFLKLALHKLDLCVLKG